MERLRAVHLECSCVGCLWCVGSLGTISLPHLVLVPGEESCILLEARLTNGYLDLHSEHTSKWLVTLQKESFLVNNLSFFFFFLKGQIEESKGCLFFSLMFWKPGSHQLSDWFWLSRLLMPEPLQDRFLRFLLTDVGNLLKMSFQVQLKYITQPINTYKVYE